MRTETFRPPAWIAHEAMASKLDLVRRVSESLRCPFWVSLAIVEGRAEVTVTEIEERPMQGEGVLR